MPEDAGSLEVKYIVISDAAIRRLERLQKQFDNVGDAAEKQGKKVQTAHKKNAKAIAAYGAVATGVLYGLIKASSYAHMWMDQLGHSMTRIANIVLEKLGLKDAIDFLVVSLGLLADALYYEDTDFWSNLADDFGELDTKAKIAVVGILAFAGALLLLGIAIGIVGLSSLITALSGVGAAAANAAGLAGMGGLVFISAILVGVILGLIGVFILWKTGVLTAIYELGEKFGTWVIGLGRKFGDWVVGMGAKFGTWVAETKEKLIEWITSTKEKFSTWASNVKETFETFKTNIGEIFDGIWTYIINGLETMKTDFISIITTIINKVSALIKKILSIPKIPSFGGGFGGGGGSFGTSISPGSMPGGGDYSATGGHVLRTGAQMVHQGEDIINLNKMMSGVRTNPDRGGDIIINPTINISTNGGISDPFEANRVADVISKRMGEELRRISTSI